MWYFPLIPIFSLLDASEIVDYILFLSCLFASAASCSLLFLSPFLSLKSTLTDMIDQFKLIQLSSEECARVHGCAWVPGCV